MLFPRIAMLLKFDFRSKPFCFGDQSIRPSEPTKSFPEAGPVALRFGISSISRPICIYRASADIVLSGLRLTGGSSLLRQNPDRAVKRPPPVVIRTRVTANLQRHKGRRL
jgi:hypothetical protein